MFAGGAVLAIDGVILSDSPAHCNYIVAEQESKILIEGLVQDIELFGNLKVGDVIVSSTYIHPI